jgi:hypothetical protein
MDLDFDSGTAAADAAAAIAAIERQLRSRLPVIRRSFIEAGERWSRPDTTQSPADPMQRRVQESVRAPAHRRRAGTHEQTRWLYRQDRAGFVAQQVRSETGVSASRSAEH